MRGSGVVLVEPSVIAIDPRTSMVQAFGYEASELLTRMPAMFTVVRPLKDADGVFADLHLTEALLRYFIQKVQPDPNARPRIVLCVPHLTDQQQSVLQEVCLSAGARAAYLIAEPYACATGAGLSLGESTAWGAVRTGQSRDESSAWLLVDVGGGTTTVSVIVGETLALSRSVRVGGDDLDDAIVMHAELGHGLRIDRQTAEQVKLDIGSASTLVAERHVHAQGRDALSDQHKSVVLSSDEVRHAFDEPVSQIIQTIRSTLDQAASAFERQVTRLEIVLVGGGALLPGMTARLHAEFELPCRVADSPLLCAGLGAGRWMEQTPAEAPPRVDVSMMKRRFLGR